MKTLHFALALLAPILAAGAAGDDDRKYPAMGADWFARLRNPQTRMKALYQHERAGADDGREIDDPEKFAADHHRTLVFPCPQPGQPGAWAVIDASDWQAGEDLLCGPETKYYAPHPLEVERRRAWDAAEANLPADFKPWQVGQPWFDSLSGFLVDAAGNQLGAGVFGSPAIIADFDADGMLDLVKIARLHMEDKGKVEPVIDCVSIGPLASALPRKVMIYCNYCEDLFTHSRAWRFTVRRDPNAALQLVLVPTAKDQHEITWQFREGKLVASADKLPEGILVYEHPAAGDFEASRVFLKQHGYALEGIGSDGALELDANLPARPHGLNRDSYIKWSLPDTAALPPREAAQAVAARLFDGYYKTQYELASIGEPAPPATQGWLERWCDPGWADDIVDVWWFVGDAAQQWTQADSTTFIVADLSAAELGRRIAVTHEIDRIRTVPKTPYAPAYDHEQIGGDDHACYRVRALTISPTPLATVFDECTPSLWQAVGSRYDRELASVIATTFVGPTPKVGKAQAIRDLAPVWLAPDNLTKIPPPLIRAAVRSIGENHWKKLEPQLKALQIALGPVTKDEQRLAEIDRLIRDYYAKQFKLRGRDEWLAKRKFNALEREQLALNVKLTGTLGYELRAAVKNSLTELKKVAP